MEMLLKKGGKAIQKPQNTNAGKISLCAKVVNVFISDCCIIPAFTENIVLISSFVMNFRSHERKKVCGQNKKKIEKKRILSIFLPNCFVIVAYFLMMAARFM